MRYPGSARIILLLIMVVLLIGAGAVVVRGIDDSRVQITAYFDNSNGIFEGDDVMILGVPVGTIQRIEPQAQRAKITFTFDSQYRVPANAKAIIIAPTLVTARAIQLVPPYSGGPVMANGAVIPQQRTAVPVEFDDLRVQLQKLTETLSPTEPGGVSTLGAFVNTAAENLRGQGAEIRKSIIELSQSISILGDHSKDIFGTVKSLSALVTALQASADLMRQLNGNLAEVSTLLADDSNEVGNAISNLNIALSDVAGFISDNRDALGTTSDKLASVTAALVDSIDDIKQALHVAPTAFGNFVNIYEPASASLTGALSLNNFSDPISFLCGAIQAASRLNFEQSAKLCVQYLAPIIKNRQYNFLPLGENFFVGPQARPNEVTFSEDWLRPISEAGRVRDYYEGPLRAGAPPAPADTAVQPVYPAEVTSTDPAAGLSGLMAPPKVGP